MMMGKGWPAVVCGGTGVRHGTRHAFKHSEAPGISDEQSDFKFEIHRKSVN